MADHSDRVKSIFGALELSTDSPLQQKQDRSNSPPKNSSSHESREHRDRGQGNRYQSGHQREPNRRHYRRDDDLRVNSGRARGRHGKRTPDHVVHPERWTRYDLAEDRASRKAGNVSDEQRNTLAAMSFLSELKDCRTGTDSIDALRRDGEGIDDDLHNGKPPFKRPAAPVDGRSSCSSRGDSASSHGEDLKEDGKEKPVFRRPALPNQLSHRLGNAEDDEKEEEQDKKSGVTSTWNHARVLPEYVVGAKMDLSSRSGRGTWRKRQGVGRAGGLLSDRSGSVERGSTATAVVMDHIVEEDTDLVVSTRDNSKPTHLDQTPLQDEPDSIATSHDIHVTCGSTASSTEVLGSSQLSHDSGVTSEQPLRDSHMTGFNPNSGDVTDNSCVSGGVVTFKKTGDKRKKRGMRSHRIVDTD